MKLFRNIRYKRILDKKLKNYFVYAIGEILLVVIGILIAVQVNNWNQQRIKANKEIQALKDIRSEFKANENSINVKQNSRKSLTPLIEEYILNISDGKANIQTFDKFHQNEFMFGMTNPSVGVLDALISSGEISLITNDSLKYLLAGWKNQLENLYENEQILWNSGLEYINSYSDKIPDSRYTWFDSNRSDLELLSSKIINSIEYRNKLVGFAGCNKIIVKECQGILEEIDKINRLLEQEIKANE